MLAPGFMNSVYERSVFYLTKQFQVIYQQNTFKTDRVVAKKEKHGCFITIW